MRRTVSAIAVFILGVGIAGVSPVAVADGGKRRRAVASAHPTGGDAVYLGRRSGMRRLIWRAPSRHERVITEVTWSKHHDGLAFATKNRRGAINLVVVLIGGDLDGHTMSWPIPRRSIERTRPTVTWLGTQRVAFGHSEVRPDVVASWSVRQ